MMRAIAFAVGLSVVNAGCYSTFDLPPQSVAQLDGFHAGEHRPIPDASGETVVFDRSTELRFVEQSGVLAAKFDAITVRGPLFTGVTRPNGAPFSIDLRRVIALQAKKFSVGKTVAAIVIPSVAVTLAFAAFALWLAIDLTHVG